VLWADPGRISMLMPIKIQTRIRIGINTMLENQKIIYFQSSQHCSLQCFIFLICAKCVIIVRTFLACILKVSWKKFSLSTFHLHGIDADPDLHALNADLDPAK
jgi:hypothetical protein